MTAIKVHRWLIHWFFSHVSAITWGNCAWISWFALKLFGFLFPIMSNLFMLTKYRIIHLPSFMRWGPSLDPVILSAADASPTHLEISSSRLLILIGLNCCRKWTSLPWKWRKGARAKLGSHLAVQCIGTCWPNMHILLLILIYPPPGMFSGSITSLLSCDNYIVTICCSSESHKFWIAAHQWKNMLGIGCWDGVSW